MKNKVNKLYEDAWQFMKNNKKNILDFNDKVYSNLLEALSKSTKTSNLYCEDIIINCTDNFLCEDFEKNTIDKNRGESLVQNIIETFELNKKTHYLLLPINGARLSTDIHFSNYHFIDGNEAEKIEKIQHITGIDKFKIHDFIEHTKKSRSKDFLMHPLLVLRIDNVSNNVYKSSSIIAQKMFQILKLLFYKLEIKEDIYEFLDSWYEDNYHVVIIGNDDWQFRHGNWCNLITFKYSLDFLAKKENQIEFVDLADTFVFESCTDELHYKFCNALEIFGKSLEQYENYRDFTLSTLLLFSAAESLLTYGDNEKRLRLSIIWPRLVTISERKQKDLCILIRDYYGKRNDFVHDGNLMFDNEVTDNIRVLHQMLAKLISEYLLKNEWKITSENPDEKDITSWNKYVRNIFTEAIYG